MAKLGDVIETFAMAISLMDLTSTWAVINFLTWSAAGVPVLTRNMHPLARQMAVTAASRSSFKARAGMMTVQVPSQTTKTVMKTILRSPRKS